MYMYIFVYLNMYLYVFLCMCVYQISSNTPMICRQYPKKFCVSFLNYAPKEIYCFYSFTLERRGHIFLVFLWMCNVIYCVTGLYTCDLFHLVPHILMHFRPKHFFIFWPTYFLSRGIINVNFFRDNVSSFLCMYKTNLKLHY